MSIWLNKIANVIQATDESMEELWHRVSPLQSENNNGMGYCACRPSKVPRLNDGEETTGLDKALQGLDIRELGKSHLNLPFGYVFCNSNIIQ